LIDLIDLIGKESKNAEGKVFSTLKEDIKTVLSKDPAARNALEVIFCYPGLHALWAHRIAHFFLETRFFLSCPIYISY